MPDQSRSLLMLTMRRFLEVAWTRHAGTRYLSVLAIPVLVAFFVPGLWWTACAAGALAGVYVDHRASVAFTRLAERAEDLHDSEMRALIDRQVAAITTMTALYSAPYVALAFAPPPGPAMGAFFCAAAALVCSCLHVMTPRMIFFTIPAPLAGLLINGLALAEGWNGVAVATMAAMLGVNAIIMARAGAVSFGELIRARLVAEETAGELERRVESRTAELALATKRAQAASRAKSIFLANMSHELRTPLNAVIGYAEIVEEDLARGETASCAEDLARIRGSAGHLLNLINEILDLSRIEAGKLELQLADVRLDEILRSTLETVRPLAAKNGTRCELRNTSDMQFVRADEMRLKQCLLNLLSNAAKFTRDGVICLRARPCTLAGGAGIAIDVCDTGKGIAASDLNRLFQPFVQADASPTRPHDGAGLGLVITRRLARAMGGDVTAASELGKGSTFTIYLPASAHERATAA